MDSRFLAHCWLSLVADCFKHSHTQPAPTQLIMSWRGVLCGCVEETSIMHLLSPTNHKGFEVGDGVDGRPLVGSMAGQTLHPLIHIKLLLVFISKFDWWMNG
jgi:hypothetical protein